MLLSRVLKHFILLVQKYDLEFYPWERISEMQSETIYQDIHNTIICSTEKLDTVQSSNMILHKDIGKKIEACELKF